MKKAICIILTVFLFSGCEQLGLVDPGADLIGTWIHVRSGAAAGGHGSITRNGINTTINQVIKDPNYNLTFEKKGLCDCLGYNRYKVKNNIITFSTTSSDETWAYEYNIFKDGLSLYESVSEWKRLNPNSNITKIDYVHSFDKQ
jgi:hypothetical protein